ncbi:MAG TPA: PUA domain-containing protein [Candidatus Nitrosopolaris sp.]|nr:PUA domain-containing protein [Candidatus Nitrosopolaris sp.]
MKPLTLNPEEKLRHHIDALFGTGIYNSLAIHHTTQDFGFEYSRSTGRIKNFSVKNQLVVTLRTDGGLALTIFGATQFLRNQGFRENCVIPTEEALPFVRQGRSLFCKHVRWCGSNVKVGSDVAIVDGVGTVVAVGRALIGCNHMRNYQKGIAVKIREGIKSPRQI